MVTEMQVKLFLFVCWYSANCCGPTVAKLGEGWRADRRRRRIPSDQTSDNHPGWSRIWEKRQLVDWIPLWRVSRSRQGINHHLIEERDKTSFCKATISNIHYAQYPKQILGYLQAENFTEEKCKRSWGWEELGWWWWVWESGAMATLPRAIPHSYPRKGKQRTRAMAEHKMTHKMKYILF